MALQHLSINVFALWQRLVTNVEWWIAGVKVSQNAPERRVWKFKPGEFWLHNYWISQPERMFPGPAS